MSFQIELAGRIIEVHPMFNKIRKCCESYLLPETERKEPDILIEITEEDLNRELVAAERENKRTGLDNRYAPDDLEISAVYRKIGTQITAFQTFVMHGSIISTAGEGYMLTAPSGVGKTTRTKLWIDNIPDSFVVNGDKPMLQVTDNCVYACGTPWCGKEGWNQNMAVPLRAIFLLERSDDGNHVSEMSFAEVFPRLLQQTFRPDDSEAKRKTLQLLQKMAGRIRIFRFFSEPTAEAVQMAWKAARGQE